MTDDGLRALERRYRETGAVDDHARWLAARVRAGVLSESRAELAGELGHEAARLALGVGLAPLTGTTIKRLVHACDGADPAQVHGRIALAVSRLALPGELTARERDGLACLSAWLDCPCAEHGAALEAAADQVLVFSEPELRALFPGAQVAILEEVLVEWRERPGGLPLWPRDLSMIGWEHHERRRDGPQGGDDWLTWTRVRHAIHDTPGGQRRLALHGLLVSIRYVGAWSAVSAATARAGLGPVRVAIAAAIGPSLLLEEEVLRG